VTSPIRWDDGKSVRQVRVWVTVGKVNAGQKEILASLNETLAGEF
jgi:hypothetical protein